MFICISYNIIYIWSIAGLHFTFYLLPDYCYFPISGGNPPHREAVGAHQTGDLRPGWARHRVCCVPGECCGGCAGAATQDQEQRHEDQGEREQS